MAIVKKLLSSFSVYGSETMLVLFGLLWLMLALIWVRAKPAGSEQHALALRWYFSALAALVLTATAWLTVAHIVTPGFFTQNEYEVPEISWYYMQGHPLYLPLNSVECYNLPYGPYLYLFAAGILKLFGPSLISVKILLVGAYDLLFVILFLLLKKYLPPSLALVFTGLTACATLALDKYLGARADPLLCLSVAIGLWAASSPNLSGALIFGAALGLAVNLKIHSVLYFLPAVAVAFRAKYTLKQWLATGFAALCLVIIPFVAFPNISLANYLSEIKVMANQGVGATEFRGVLAGAFYLLMPFGLLALVAWRQNASAATGALQKNALLIGSVLASLLIVAIPASKVGAGGHHLEPWMISLPYLAARLYQDGFAKSESFLPGWTVVCLATWVLSCFSVGYSRLINIHHWLNSEVEARAVDADISRLITQYQKKYVLQMGVGNVETFPETFHRLTLIFADMPIGIDPVALADFKRGGYSTPDLTALSTELGGPQKKPLLWLIPKGTPPFSLPSVFPPFDSLYDDHFRFTFAHDYKLMATSDYFDLYTSPNLQVSH